MCLLRHGLLTFMLSDGGISRIRQRTRLPRAETRKVVLVPAEVLGGRLNLIGAEPDDRFKRIS